MLHNAQIVGFLEGTPILMADGKWKPIEKVQQGDWVMSFDPNSDASKLEPRKVTDTMSAIHNDCIEVHCNGKMTVVAKDQLFFAPGASWLPGYDTKQVLDFSGTPQNIQVRRVRGGKHKIFDVIVDDTHSLVANDLRVHNGTKKKKKVQAPQPVVTAGKPGKPVSVTTTHNGNTTTVVVNPSPGASAQVSVGSNGSIGVGQTVVPGLPVSDGTDYMPYTVLPYPGGSYVQDRARNAEIIRASICGAILDKGKNYKVTKADEKAWETELDNMLTEIRNMKSAGIIPMTSNKRAPAIGKDPTIINDAVNAVNQIKKELKAGRKVSIGLIRQNCDKLASMITRIAGSVVPPGGGSGYTTGGGGPIYNPIGREPGYLPGRGNEGMYPAVCDPVWDRENKRWLVPPCQPTPIISTPNPGGTIPDSGNYQSNRIYEGNANFNYMTRISDSCSFVYDPPNGEMNTAVRYYRHVDENNKAYYDRISNGANCTSGIL